MCPRKLVSKTTLPCSSLSLFHILSLYLTISCFCHPYLLHSIDDQKIWMQDGEEWSALSSSVHPLVLMISHRWLCTTRTRLLHTFRMKTSVSQEQKLLHVSDHIKSLDCSRVTHCHLNHCCFLIFKDHTSTNNYVRWLLADPLLILSLFWHNCRGWILQFPDH